MRIATWNINSVRLRLPLVLKFMAETSPDVLCLQETKCPDDQFPVKELARHGYPHLHFAGMKGYNGVAIASRLPLSDCQVISHCGKDDCRHISARLPGDIILHNLYIPSGGDLPNRETNPKFAHKLDFIDGLAAWFQDKPCANNKQIAVGDFNIAPGEHDVWSHRQMRDVVSHTRVEIDKLANLRQSLDWLDVARHFAPEDQKLYSWWSYRARDWTKSNRGRRLDHIWITQPLAPTLQTCQTLSDARNWERPSDHVPVIADFNPTIHQV